jgi:hypothetical protein
MVMFKKRSEQRRKLCKRVWTSSIDSDSTVSILTARKNGFLERISESILLVFELVPNVSGQELVKQRTLLTLWESWEPSELFWFL